MTALGDLSRNSKYFLIDNSEKPRDTPNRRVQLLRSKHGKTVVLTVVGETTCVHLLFCLFFFYQMLFGFPALTGLVLLDLERGLGKPENCCPGMKYWIEAS